MVRSGVEYLLASQNADGSWGDVHEPDVHKRYHTAWTAIDGLRDYSWSERTEWPAGVREVLLGPALDRTVSPQTGHATILAHDPYDFLAVLLLASAAAPPCSGAASDHRPRTVLRRPGDRRRADLPGRPFLAFLKPFNGTRNIWVKTAGSRSTRRGR